MSHCGLCGAYINDQWEGWSVCDDCVDEQRRYPPLHEQLANLPVRTRIKIFLKSFLAEGTH